MNIKKIEKDAAVSARLPGALVARLEDERSMRRPVPPRSDLIREALEFFLDAQNKKRQGKKS